MQVKNMLLVQEKCISSIVAMDQRRHVTRQEHCAGGDLDTKSPVGDAVMPSQTFIRWFETLRSTDVAIVGGKTASLGELYSSLSARGINVPNGFGITAEAYRAALSGAGAWQQIAPLLEGIGEADTQVLAHHASAARKIVYDATGTPQLREQIGEAYRKLEAQYGRNVPVAVRSSATAEDLPNASFAGQHDSFVNIRGVEAVFEACRHCFASIFTDRAIVYRNNNGFSHAKVALSVAVMKMVRSDISASGVIFTLDTDSGFRDVVMVTGIYGLGENIVQGRADPDEFYVHKPTFKNGHRAVLRRTLGEKQVRMCYARGKITTTVNRPVPMALRQRLCLKDDDVLALAGYAMAIEEHYSALGGRATPMDIEWAKDGEDGTLYIVQARPETVVSQRAAGTLKTYVLKGKQPAIVSGRAIGEKIASGKVHIVRNESDLAHFKAGDVLVSDTTSPDWLPVMKKAAGIVTNRGGRTCHAAIVARELGVPAVVGTERATKTLQNGASITVSCAEGELGHVYEGSVPFDVVEMKL